VQVAFDTQDQTGKAVVVGDQVFLLDDGAQIDSLSVSQTDFDNGYVTFSLVTDEERTFDLTAYIIDKAENRSPTTSEAVELVVDLTPPSVQISTSAEGLAPSEQAEITITFSEAVSGFSVDDIVVSGGAVSNLSASTSLANGAVQYLATFTAPASELPSLSIEVPADSYGDVAGNNGLASNVIDLQVDSPPTVSIADDTAGVAREAVLFTLSFSEAVTGFNADDISVTGGVAGSLSQLSATLYTIDVTPDADSSSPISVSVAAAAFTDANGNANVAEVSVSQAVDTIAPDAPTINAVASDDDISKLEKLAGVDIGGQAEAGATVKLTFAGESRLVSADASTGAWSYRLNDNDFALIGEGTASISAQAIDAVGNVSTTSTRSFVVDSQSPVFGAGTASNGLDLYSYVSTQAPAVVYQAEVEALSPVDYELIGNTSPYSIDATSGAVSPDPSVASQLAGQPAGQIIGRDFYDLSSSYTITIRATDVYGNARDHDVTIDAAIPRIDALGNFVKNSGGFSTSLVDGDAAFVVSFTSIATSVQFAADVSLYTAELGDVEVNWNAIISDTTDSADGSSTGIGSPFGTADGFAQYVGSNADGSGTARIGAIVVDDNSALSAGDLVFSLSVSEARNYPVWLHVDGVDMGDDVDTSDWSTTLFYRSDAPTSVTGSAASEWFDIAGEVSVTGGVGADVFSYNYVTTGHDVTLTDFVSGEDVIDLSPAMSALGYEAIIDMADTPSAGGLRVHIGEVVDDDAFLTDMAPLVNATGAADIVNLLETAIETDISLLDSAAITAMDDLLVVLFDEGSQSLSLFVDQDASAGSVDLANVTWSLGSASFSQDDLYILQGVVI
jgi:hypothetical protein